MSALPSLRAPIRQVDGEPGRVGGVRVGVGEDGHPVAPGGLDQVQRRALLAPVGAPGGLQVRDLAPARPDRRPMAIASSTASSSVFSSLRVWEAYRPP